MIAVNDYIFDDVDDVIEAISHLDMAERARWIHQNRMILFERLGAVITRSGGDVNYWRISTNQFNYDFNITPLLSLSGFV